MAPKLRLNRGGPKCLEKVSSAFSPHHILSKKYDMSLAKVDPSSPLQCYSLSPSLSSPSGWQFVLNVQRTRNLIEQNIRWKKSPKHDSILDVNGSSGEAERRKRRTSISEQSCLCANPSRMSSISSSSHIRKPLRSARFKRFSAPSSVLFQTFATVSEDACCSYIAISQYYLHNWCVRTSLIINNKRKMVP